MESLKRTALYANHLAAKGKLVPFAGYEMPLRYGGDVAEHLAVRQQAGLFDVSHMGEFLFRGPDALELLMRLTVNDVSKVPVGRAQYNCMCRPEGGIIDDLIIYRLEDELFMMVVNASNIEKDWAWVQAQNTNRVPAENISEATSLLALSGPEAPHIISRLTQAPVLHLPYYAQLKGTVAGIENVLVATTGYTGERSFELYVRNEHAPRLWEALLEAGAPNGLVPAGLGARDSLRLEMGYLLYGNDMDEARNPLEAGLGWITKLDKPSFIGKASIENAKASAIGQKLVAFEAAERGIPRRGIGLVADGRVVGHTTSGVFSPSLKTGIGMAYVDAAFSKTGTLLSMDQRGKTIPCKVVKAPFVKDTSLASWVGK